jgi:dynein heavy chain
MNLIFEPMDLLAASPATVSRCGMIYMEPASLGSLVLFDSWIARVRINLNEAVVEDIIKLFELTYAAFYR